MSVRNDRSGSRRTRNDIGRNNKNGKIKKQ